MRKEIIKTVMGGVLISGLFFSEAFGEILKWVDEEGKVHLTEDPSTIPERYREQAKKLSVLEENEPQKEDLKSPKRSGSNGTIQKSQSQSKEARQSRSQRIESDVREAFERILSLWKDGKYQALYEYGDRKSRTRIAKEEFERRMKKRRWELASSWERVRDVEVETKGDSLAYVSAKIGYRPKQGGETRFQTQTYQMRFEKGGWRIDLTKLLQDPRR